MVSRTRIVAEPSEKLMYSALTTNVYFQRVGELPEERLGRAYTFLNKSAKAMPYINRHWKNRPLLLEKFASYLDPPSYKEDEASIDMAPFPARIERDGSIVFRDNGRKEAKRMRDRVVKPDVMVYATGYRHSFPFLSDEYHTVLDRSSCRDVFHTSDPTVGFIGFVRPGVGAIPPISELQAQMWNMVIRGQLAPPTGAVHYNLIVKDPGARVLHGVDHSAYSAQLATDMGATPYPWQLWWRHGLLVTFVYCFGAAFPTFYRLMGPYEHRDAPRITRTELFETIKRRGLVGNITFGVIAITFYAYINAFALGIELVIRALERVFPTRVSLAGVEKYLEQRTGSFRAYDDLTDEELAQVARKTPRARKMKAEERYHKMGYASSEEFRKLTRETLLTL